MAARDASVLGVAAGLAGVRAAHGRQTEERSRRSERHATVEPGSTPPGAPAFAWLVLAFAYFIVCERLFGATVGKRIFSLRVEGRDGGLPTWGQSVGRNLPRIVDGFPYVLPYLVGFVVAKSNADRRRLGDSAAGTRVVSSS
jgi:uncharacterized RDD family membrane protein YckC